MSSSGWPVPADAVTPCHVAGSEVKAKVLVPWRILITHLGTQSGGHAGFSVERGAGRGLRQGWAPPQRHSGDLGVVAPGLPCPFPCLAALCCPGPGSSGIEQWPEECVQGLRWPGGARMARAIATRGTGGHRLLLALAASVSVPTAASCHLSLSGRQHLLSTYCAPSALIDR